MNGKQIYVIFCSKKLESSFESLKKEKFQDKKLYDSIEKAIKNLKNNPSCGTKIPKKLWSKIYIQKYKTTNLWKYNLPNGWRLVYTIKTDEIMILSVILEWFDHKNYEKRFNY